MRNNVDVQAIHKRGGEYLSFEYANYKFHLEIRYPMIGIIGNSGVGKTCWFPSISEDSENLDLPLMKYFNQKELKAIEIMTHGNIDFSNRPERIIILDNADTYFKNFKIKNPELFLDVRDNIACDPNHIYILIGRALPFELSQWEVARFNYDKSEKTFYLKYISD